MTHHGTRFEVISPDGTRVAAWRNNGPVDGVPVVISNGLGTMPEAWPTLVAQETGLRVVTWYYRGTFGGDKPADLTHVTIEDHVADLIALMDHEGIERAVVPCWSMGVNIGFEAARLHPERVAGLLAVAGVPGGTFRAMGGPLRIPRPLRHRVGVTGARTLKFLSPALNLLAASVPLNRFTASLIRHSGFIMPGAKPEILIPALREFCKHDFSWYFTLALAVVDHAPMDLAFVTVPTTLVAGRYDVLTSHHDMFEAASRIPHAEVEILPGSHFLPLEFPNELVDYLRGLIARTDLAPLAA